MKNIVVSVPPLETHRPPISSAIIASILENAGQEVEVVDLNIEFYKFLGDDEYYSLDSVWESNRSITPEETNSIRSFINKKFITKLDINTRVLISVFAKTSFIFSKILCEEIRKNYPQCEIILGGQGVSNSGTVNNDVKNNSITFGAYMLQSNLCDHVIFGEGEVALSELLKGNLQYPGIDSDLNLEQINNLDVLPFPDYKFYDLNDYDYLEDKKEVNIYGSRGCVRKCTYCDVAVAWPKYRYRSGGNIATEIIEHYEKHGVTKFYFTDSLVNGSLKAFRDMCETLAKYNQDNNVNFSWGGQFIFRPKRQLTDDYFDMIAAAGGDTFYVGVETGSDKIRWEMDKKFTNEDIDYHLEHFQRTGLRCFFLMVCGYLTETLDDHNEILKMYPRWQKYVASGTITGIDLGKTLTFDANTPLEGMITTHGVEFLAYEKDILDNLKPNAMIWESKLNPDLTFRERMRRRLEIHETAMKYKWPIWRGPQRLEGVLHLAKLFTEQENVQI